jgi:hypothetical protein
VFDDAFWGGLDVVVNALDNVNARCGGLGFATGIPGLVFWFSQAGSKACLLVPEGLIVGF